MCSRWDKIVLNSCRKGDFTYCLPATENYPSVGKNCIGVSTKYRLVFIISVKLWLITFLNKRQFYTLLVTDNLRFNRWLRYMKYPFLQQKIIEKL